MTAAKDIYRQLSEKAPQSEGTAFRAFACADGLRVKVFIDGKTRMPGFNLTLARNRVPANISIPRVRGADLQIVGEPAGDVTYELSATGSRYKDVFIELADRLVTEAVSMPSPESAISCFAQHMDAWARFFDSRGDTGLARSAQLGLIGELLCLGTIATELGLPTAVDAWTGPAGTPHDFQTPLGAVEAKLTTSASPERFRISSERQLDESQIPWLLLFAVVAQEAASGPVSLPGMVASLRDRILGSATGTSGKFEDRLHAAGYADADAASYSIHIVVHHMALLRVHADFPRVRPTDLRPGVFGVSYEIPWANIAPYRVEFDELRKLNDSY